MRAVFGCSQSGRKLTGLSGAIQLWAKSFGVDCYHGDGVLSVRGQLGEQDSILLPSNLGLEREEYMSAYIKYSYNSLINH